MKKTLLLIAISLIITSLSGQVKKRAGVKKKYRKTEAVSEALPPVYLRGKVRNAANDLLAGVKVMLVGSLKEVNTNADGEYFFYSIPTGKLTIQASLMGYRTKATDFEVQTGQNYLNFTLDEDRAKVDPMVTATQKREQQVLDIPASVSVADADFLEKTGLTTPDRISEFFPGTLVEVQSIIHPSVTLRGITSDNNDAGIHPGVSFLYNNVPVNGLRDAIPGFFDMQQVEAVKGPLGTLAGRNALAGSVHYLSEKPGKEFGGYITAGIGNYYRKEAKAAINLPLVKKKLFARFAGIYTLQDGYVKNTSGGTLMGSNTTGGRFSLRYLPAYNKKLDLVVNYLHDNNPGVAFMSGGLANTRGETSPFSYFASLEKGSLLKTKRELMDATLNFNHFYNEHFYWTSISSFRNVRTSERSDGDGTVAPAIDLKEDWKAWQVYQEVRFNYSSNNKLNGASGVSFTMDKAGQISGFSSDEQSLFFLCFNPAGLVNESGVPFTMPALPVLPFLEALSGIPLPANHQETTKNKSFNRSIQAYTDGTWNLWRNLSITGGIRAGYDLLRLTGSSQFTGGSESTLGRINGYYPNFFVAPFEDKKMSDNGFSLTGRAAIKYNFSEKTAISAGISKGLRLPSLQFSETGEGQKTNPEKLYNIEGGFKTMVGSRFWFEATGFYQRHEDFTLYHWVTEPETGMASRLMVTGNKADFYGMESSLKVAVLRGVELFGNAAWIHALYSKVDSTDARFPFSGNAARLTPEYSFSAGMNLRLKIKKGPELFATPVYSCKSHFWFDDTNTPGIDQDAYGILNVAAGITFKEPGITLSGYGTNLLNEQYLISAGNAGLRFGSPTFVPGAPRMFGTKVVWRF